MSRLGLDNALRRRRPGNFPWPTLVINVSGSLVLGLLAGLVLFQGASNDLKLVAGTGFCGGYTTFSTASFESVRLFQQRRTTAAIVVTFGTLALTTAAAALGLGISAL